MATALSNLLALLALDNSSFMDGLKQSQDASATFGSKMATVGGAVVLGALTAASTAVIGIGSAAFDAAETLDEAYDSIAVATGAMGPDLDALKDDFDAVFAAIPTDAGAAADVIGILNTRLGLTDDLLRDLTIPLLEVTRLLGGDAKTNTELFTRAIGDWNIPFDQAAGYLDMIYVGAQQTGVPLDALLRQVVQYGAPMRNFGFDFAHATALLAVFESQGVNTEIVMSGMRIAQGKYITSGVDMTTGLWDTIDAIKTAKDKTEGLAIATEFFGAKAAGDMYDTIVAGKFDIVDGLINPMLDSEGAIMKAAAATSDWGEKWKIFQNKMTLALGPLGEKLREGMGKALDDLLVIFERPDIQAAIERFTNFAVTTISAIVAYIPTLIGSIASFVDYLQNNQGIVIGVFAALGVAAAVWGVVTAAAAWTAIAPLLPVIAVLALVAAAAYFLYQAWVDNFGGIQDKVAVVWGVLQPILQNLWEWLKTNIPVAIQTLASFWTDTLVPSFQTAIGAIQAVVGFFTDLLGPSLQQIGATIGLLQPQFTSAWAVMRDATLDFWSITKPLWEAIGGILLTVLAVIGMAVVTYVGFIVAAMSGFANAVAAAAAWFAPIIAGISNMSAGVINVISGVLEFIGGLFTLNGKKISEGFMLLLGGLLQILGGTVQLIVGIVGAALNFIYGFIEGWIRGIVAFFTGLYDALVGHSIVPDMMNAILLSFTSVLQNIIGVLGDWVTKIVEKFTSLFDDVVDIFTTGWELIKTSISTAVTNIIDFFKTTDWGAVGTNIIKGIANGITDGLDWIIDAAESAIKAAIDAAKKIAGIKSPSSVFEMQVGWQMAAGVAEGWVGGLASMLNPAMANLIPVSVTPSMTPNAGGSPQNSDMLVMEEIRRMLRDLPNEIARATTSAAAKMPRSR